MTAYYNEHDPYAAEWLRRLIARNVIMPGEVDTRSIVDVRPNDLRGFVQCHFFAGIGVWSYALRRGGWPDSRPVWTGSCPCQPFSTAGKRLGFADERHLWPAWHHLIRVCRPPIVHGEQVASKDGSVWLDLVQADMEGEDYAGGPVDTPAAGYGAPHIRQRNYFVFRDCRLEYSSGDGRLEWRTVTGERSAFGRRSNGVLGHAGSAGSEVGSRTEKRPRAVRIEGDAATPAILSRGLADDRSRRREMALQHTESGGSSDSFGQTNFIGGDGLFGELADASSEGRLARFEGLTSTGHGATAITDGGTDELVDITRAGPTNGFWRDTDWLLCRDGRWRPVESGTFPLAHGAPARVGRLRAYGNAINAEHATAWIEAYLDLETTAIDGEFTVAGDPPFSGGGGSTDLRASIIRLGDAIDTLVEALS